MKKTIKTILYSDFRQNYLLKSTEAKLLADLGYDEFEKYKNLLDNNFENQFVNVKNKDYSEIIEQRSDRLTELAYTKFLSNQKMNLEHLKGTAGLDIKINNIFGWGEYKNIRLGSAQNGTNYLISRITNALSKKYVAVNKYSTTKHKSETYIKDNEPVILFFEYSKKVVNTYLSQFIDNEKDSKSLPLEFMALFPIDNKTFNKNKITIQKQQNLELKNLELNCRFFTDMQDYLKDNDKTYLCDFTKISAVVFSQTITNYIFDSNWKNDLILIHNPYARNPIPEKLFDTKEEYRINVKNTKFTIKEIHTKSIKDYAHNLLLHIKNLYHSFF